MDVRLREIGDRIPPAEIDEIWVFPPLPEREFASEFIVLSCFEAADRRRIVTAHLEADSPGSEDDPAIFSQRVEEHGTAPERFVAGIPDRLLERLADAGVPRVFSIGGEPARWADAVCELCGNGGGPTAPNGAAVPNAAAARNGVAAANGVAAPNGAHGAAGSTALDGSPDARGSAPAHERRDVDSVATAKVTSRTLDDPGAAPDS